MALCKFIPIFSEYYNNPFLKFIGSLLKSPENIQELVQQLSDSSKTHYNSIMNGFDFNTIDFKPFESWSSEKYTRNCMYRDAQFELLLLCWEEGQETSIHNHDGKDCWVYLLEGKMEEVFYTLDINNTLKETHLQSMTPHQSSFMNDNIGFHKLRNVFKGKSISLHLYAKPIEQCQFYCKNSNQFIERKLKYDTFNEFVIETKPNAI